MRKCLCSFLNGDAGEDNVCAVCLESLEEGSEVRRLRCTHVFHPLCIELWTARSLICPTCRLEVVPAEQRQKAGDAEGEAAQTMPVREASAEEDDVEAQRQEVADDHIHTPPQSSHLQNHIQQAQYARPSSILYVF